MNKRELLKKHLEARGLSLAEFAQRAGIIRSVLYKFLSGQDIRLATWERIEAAMADQPEAEKEAAA